MTRALRKIDRKVRRGEQLTVDEAKAWGEYEDRMHAAYEAQRTTVRSALHLPMARGMWEADARDIKR